MFNAQEGVSHGSEGKEADQDQAEGHEDRREEDRREEGHQARQPEGQGRIGRKLSASASDVLGFPFKGTGGRDEAFWRSTLNKAHNTGKKILDYRGDLIDIPAFGSSHELRKWASEKDNGIGLLSFSRGKDSIAAYLGMRPYYKELHLLYYSLIPGLECIEENLQYFERKWGVRIHRLPHPKFWEMQQRLVYQSPTKADAIVGTELPRYDYEGLQLMMKRDLAIPRQTLCGTGVRWGDNVQRCNSIKTNGVVSPKRYSMHCVWDWSMDDIRSSFAKDDIKLPFDYKLFGNSLDGIDYRYMVKLRDYYPRDYQTALDYFPLIEAELHRYEKRLGYRTTVKGKFYLHDLVTPKNKAKKGQRSGKSK